eukprot:COSAG03_NODE_126_length_12149_cov_3.594274_15_plen_133_part_00
MPYITRPAGAVSTQRWAEPLALRRCRSRRADRSLVVGVSTKYEQCCFSPVPLPLRAWVMSHEEARSVPGVSRDPGVGVFSARVRHILRLPRYHPDTGHKEGLMPGVTSTFYSGILGVTVETGHTRVKIVRAY